MMNKIYKILFIIIAISSSTFLCAMEHPTTTTHETNLLDLPNEMLMQIAQDLPNRTLAEFNQAARRTQAITQETLKQRHEQWISRNIITINCSFLRNDYLDVDGFIYAVLEKLASEYTANPDRWFELNLTSNNLGNLSATDLKKPFDTIVQRAIVSLNLSFNNLQTLPDNIFDRFGNLQKLSLFFNQLQTLPNNIFDNLGNLKELGLSSNQLQTLPNNIFDRLGNLQWLSLNNNQLDHATQNALKALKTAQPGIDILF